jgi:hypothetical protein
MAIPLHRPFSDLTDRNPFEAAKSIPFPPEDDEDAIDEFVDHVFDGFVAGYVDLEICIVELLDRGELGEGLRDALCNRLACQRWRLEELMQAVTDPDSTESQGEAGRGPEEASAA